MAAALKEASKSGSLQDGHIPPLATMFEDVFELMPAHLHEQMRQAAEQQESGPPSSLRSRPPEGALSPLGRPGGAD
jgi:hypothetical protein